MTHPQRELTVLLAHGNASELSRTFTFDRSHGPLSVGTQGDWTVSAEGVLGVHLWLQFDGQHLYVASAGGGATTYLQNMPLGQGWHEVLERGELRFGQACLRVSMSHVKAQERQLSPIERAAALPLPAFFSERLRKKGHPSPVAPEAPHRRLRRPRVQQASARHLRPESSQRAGWALLALGIAASLLFIFGMLWLTGVGRHTSASAAHSESNARALPPASVQIVEQTPVLQAPTLPDAPLPEPRLVPAVAAEERSPTIASLTPTSSRVPPPTTGQAYPQNVADKPVPRLGAEPSVISEEWLARHERQLHAPKRAQAKVLFLGDSITEGWGVATAYRDSFGQYTPLNLGLAGDFTQNVLWRIAHGTLTGTNPRVVVLMVGINNLAGGFSPPNTVAGIEAIVLAVQAQLPTAHVLLLGILPAHQKPTDPLRQRIIEANQLLAGFHAPRVSFHDVGSVMLEPDGSLSSATMRDFIHPTPAGYERLSAIVAPLVDERLASGAN